VKIAKNRNPICILLTPEFKTRFMLIKNMPKKIRRPQAPQIIHSKAQFEK
jgi:hypothetical protein